MPQFLILGAGPTGLGAAHRLHELGQTDWLLLEREATPGGLAGSVRDDRGFIWDFGGHVQFSHYEYFDRLMDDLLGPEGWVYHEREAWVWMRDAFHPYPLQYNIHRLPREEVFECLRGLVRLMAEPPGRRPANFGEWIDQSFGAGLARVFMRPYNFKVWAYPPEELAFHWIGERVAMVSLDKLLDNVWHAKDDISWGPNNTFRFPRNGGTGSIWRECARRLPQERLLLGADVAFIDTANRRVRLTSGEEIAYEHLISSLPLDLFIQNSDLADRHGAAARKLVHSSTHIIGVGMKGRPPESLRTKCWMYFPEENCPFYRVTVFSNYGPGNVPDPEQYWSLMAEVSESRAKPVDEARVVEETIQGLLNTKLLPSREAIVTTWARRLEYGYPTPSLRRDEALGELLPALDKLGVHSRGRFGAWKYEVSNQDHSMMQGVECVNRLLYGTDELTVWYPGVVNNMNKPWKGR